MKLTEQFFQQLEEYRMTIGIDDEAHPLYVVLANSQQILKNQELADIDERLIGKLEQKILYLEGRLKEYQEDAEKLPKTQSKLNMMEKSFEMINNDRNEIVGIKARLKKRIDLHIKTKKDLQEAKKHYLDIHLSNKEEMFEACQTDMLNELQEIMDGKK